MNLSTTACIHSRGKKIAGKDCQSKKLISRINSVNQLLCDLEQRITSSRFKLARYCEVPSSSESSSSSSSSECFKPCVDIPEYLYMITSNDLDGDVYDLIDLLEQEACALLRKVVDFEASNQPCVESSSSSSLPASSSSSSSLPAPSSSSSSLPPSSSSSSIPEPAPTCPESLYIASYCPELSHTSVAIYHSLSAYPPMDQGDCVYYGTIPFVPIPPEIGVSSSSSLAPPGLEISLMFNEPTNQWQIRSEMHGLIATKLGYEFDPRGTYIYSYGACSGQSIFVV